MKIISLFIFVALFIVASTGNSQTFEVPANYQLKEASDYAKYEKDIIGAAKWLLEVPFNEQAEKRQEVGAFVLLWVNGSPTVKVEINEIILDFNKKNDGMLLLYMAASARFVLENNYNKDMRAKHHAAISDMITAYKAGKGIKKDKKMDKLIKSYDGGKLDEWLNSNLKVNAH